VRTAKLRQILDGRLLDGDRTAERQQVTPSGTVSGRTTGDWSIDELSDRASTDDR
jgi:hypothetical protein